MAVIELTTLGRTELTGADGVAILSVLSQPKRFAILVYLAVEGSGGLIRRDTVAALFWPERDQADARANLRKSLYFLRQSLGQDVILTRGDEEIGIDPSRLRCDVVTLLSKGDASATGTFLEGFHFSGAPVEWEHWLESVRARARAALAAAEESPLPPVPPEPDVEPEDVLAGASGGTDTRWRVVAFALAAVLTGVLALGLMNRERDSRPTRYDPIRLGSGAQFPGVVHRHYALPPDGSGILFRDSVGRKQGSWWKPLDELEATYLEGLDDLAAPTFSADGEWIAFARDGQLLKQRFAGGPSVFLADSVSDDFSPGIAWLPDGDILFEDVHHDLRRVSEEDGTVTLVATTEEVGEVFHVQALPGGRGVLVTGCDDWCDAEIPRLSWIDLERDTVVRLRSDVWMAWPMSDGRVVIVDGSGAVFASSFDPDDAELGVPIPLLDEVKAAPFPDMVLGPDGSLLYVPGEVDPYGERLVWVDRQGRSQTVDPDWPRNWRIRSLSLSPNGRRLALGMRTDVDSTGEQIWIKALPTGALSPITRGPPMARRPVWSPDGRTVAFITHISRPDSASTAYVSTLPADASSSVSERLLEHEEMILEVALSEDWRTAAVRTGHTELGQADIAFTPVPRGERWQAVVASEANEYGISLSPDSRWLAYVSEVSGRPEVYVRPFPGPGPRVQVSRDGAVEPRWAHSGTEIFFRSLRPDGRPGEDTAFMEAAVVSTDPTFRVQSIQTLFGTSGYVRGPAVPLYDVTADDQRFIMVTHYGPRDWRQGEAAYSRGWYWTDEIQAKLGR